MKLVMNFGHPLSKKTNDQIQRALGPAEVVRIKVQVDLSLNVGKQVDDICRQAVAQYGKPDYIILPGLAPAAVHVDRYFSQAQDDYPPCVSYTPIIQLVMEPGTTPPIYVFSAVE